MRNALYLLLILLVASCLPVKEEVLTEIRMDLEDPNLQRIFSFQDAAQIDSLRSFFEHSDPTYRYAAAMAMASVRNKNTLNDLAGLLRDTIQEVRMAAAYAIGQIGAPEGENLLIQGFDNIDSLNMYALYNKSNGTILEAIGRCGGKESLDYLAQTTAYTSQDTALLNGQAWGLYRYATRGMTSPEGTQRMVQILGDNRMPPSTRFIASNYLYRAKNIVLDSSQAVVLAEVLKKSGDPRVRMTTAIALGKTKLPIAQQTLTSRFAIEQDYRVKCNILRALGNFPYPQMQGMFFELIKNADPKIALTASDFFVNHGDANDARVYWRRARKLTNIPVKMNMYKAANRYMSPTYKDYKWLINNDLKIIYQDSTQNVYQRAAALEGLAEYVWNYKYLYEQLERTDDPVLRTAAMQGIATICTNPQFDQLFGLSRRRVKKELSVFLADAIAQDDPAVRAIAAGVLADEASGYKEMYENSSFLHIAKRDLSLPQEIETYYAIQKAIAHFDDENFEPTPPAYNHPLDWSQLKGVTSNTQAIVRTSKGNFTMQFLPLAAPASVANFIQLSRSGFYKDKVFHRVVPNFVIQTGCSRGDGYGGLDYTIRSEVPLLHYDREGYVGMASAGKDTEGTQWFITHSPTPHLDGNYTIFAKVVKGIDVVHQIEVGDKIKDIDIVLETPL